VTRRAVCSEEPAMWKRLLLPLVCLSAGLAWAQEPAAGYPAWAATPPMGWNSWDSYGTAVREQDVKANADFAAEHLAKLGWKYVVVDIQWYQPQAQGHDYDPAAKLTMDGHGRLLPAPNRFPSGFKALADYVHGKGLKFGIHIMRGIPRQAVAQNLLIEGTDLRARDIAEPDNHCRWNPDMWGIDTTRPGSQAYYDSIVDLYASWGVDFIKADDMGSHLYQPAEIKALHRAILKCGRPIVLSISPGPAPVQEAAFFQKHSQMWRISDDFWDEWRLLRQQFEYARDWAPEIGKENTWPDADMLPIGRLRLAANGGKGESSRFTPDEQRTMMTLWSIMRSPLIMGGDLPRCDTFTLSLLTNPEVIGVDQHSRNNRPVLTRGDFTVWTAEASDANARYVAVFNLGDGSGTFEAAWKELGIPGERWALRDLWRREDVGAEPGLRLRLAPHASALFQLAAP
jgi:alpha-galactosidase